jgi:hypothetical protein
MEVLLGTSWRTQGGKSFENMIRIKDTTLETEIKEKIPPTQSQRNRKK